MATRPFLRALANYDVLFVRHGNTGSAPTDLERVLSDLGRRQAGWARDTFLSTTASSALKAAPLLPFALSSPAVRCLETARIALPETVVSSSIHPVKSIYGGTLQPGCSDLFKRLSYSPLSTYLDDGAEARELLAEYAEEVLQEVAAVAEAHAGEVTPPLAAGERRSLCVFGHAVYSASAAHLLATERRLGAESVDAILNYNNREACGFWVGSDCARVLDHNDGA